MLLIFLSNNFLIIDLITLFAITLEIISIVGIIERKKWGPLTGIFFSLFDSGLKLVFLSSDIFLTIILNLIITILAIFEFKKIKSKKDNFFNFENSSLEKSEKIQVPSIEKYCRNCGSPTQGEFCFKCGKKLFE